MGGGGGFPEHKQKSQSIIFIDVALGGDQKPLMRHPSEVSFAFGPRADQ